MKSLQNMFVLKAHFLLEKNKYKSRAGKGKSHPQSSHGSVAKGLSSKS